jgi:hypothetical protein
VALIKKWTPLKQRSERSAVHYVSQLRGAGCVVESLGQLCGAEQCVLVDTVARSTGCEL